MQAIITKYMPATNSRGARIKASCGVKSITIDYPRELDIQDAHRAAAGSLIIDLGWLDYGPLLCGSMPDGSGYAFVFDHPISRG